LYSGMSIYTLITLAAFRPGFSPVLSTTLAFIFAGMFDRLPHELRARAEAMVLRLLPGLDNQIFTTELDEARGKPF
jgi:hypothetical protein